MLHSLTHLLLPELLLATVACVLMLLGCSMKISFRRLVPMLAMGALVLAFIIQLNRQGVDNTVSKPAYDEMFTLRLHHFGQYIKLLAAGIGALLLLLSWPTNATANGNDSFNVGQETGEYFGLFLLAITGLFLVAGANDIILLFLGIELASIPTYIMVSISRPNPVAQEAGVKYFFLGAMSAAVMLFGFSYLYGTTGSIRLDEIAIRFHENSSIKELQKAALEKDSSLHSLRDQLTAATGKLSDLKSHGYKDDNAEVVAAKSTVAKSTDAVKVREKEVHAAVKTAGNEMRPWMMLAVVLLVVGFAFKLAAVPFQVYVADVYQGAATPLTAFLSFVPKATGMVALIKVLYAAGGTTWILPQQICTLLWVIAVLTMTFGNVLGLLQTNVKRMLAYSSVAHSGYMLTGIATLCGAASSGSNDPGPLQTDALQGVIFYLTAYGIMNTAIFGVLMLLPSRDSRFGKSAETLDDIAGQGKRQPMLGICMAVGCLSLIGMPLTVGFIGKLLLIKPALAGGFIWLVVLTMINAAISAAYYLRIVSVMFFGKPTFELPEDLAPAKCKHPMPIMVAIGVSVVATLLLGTFLPITQVITTSSGTAAAVDTGVIAGK